MAATLSGVWEEALLALDSLATEASSEPGTPFFGAVNRLTEAARVLAVTTRRLDNNVPMRQRLIDEQVFSRTFAGPLHERYHQISEEIRTDLISLHAGVKTLLNRVPHVYVELLPHAYKARVRTRSFGSLVLSLQGFIFPNPAWEAISNDFLLLAAEIDQENNDYRDKLIEHTTRSTPRYTALGTGAGEAWLEHYDLSSLYQPSGKGPTGAGKSYYVHVSSELGPGQQVTQGQHIGSVADDGSGHFDKYGPHFHLFWSRGLSIEPSDSLAVDRSSLASSPGAWAITEKLAQYLQMLARFGEDIQSSGKGS